MLVSARMSILRHARTIHPPPPGDGPGVLQSGLPAAIPAPRTLLRIDSQIKTTLPTALREIWLSNRQIQLVESEGNPYKHCIVTTSNRQKTGSLWFSTVIGFLVPVPRRAGGTRASQYRCSPPNFICYSHRRTRVPPVAGPPGRQRVELGGSDDARQRPRDPALRRRGCCGGVCADSPRVFCDAAFPP
jgi:hypothetical protein